MLCKQCFLAVSSIEAKRERRKSVSLAVERFSLHLCEGMGVWCWVITETAVFINRHSSVIFMSGVPDL